jgi:type IV secretory pathway VirJ component
MPVSLPKPRRVRTGIAVVALLLFLGAAGRLWFGGYFDRDPVWHYAPAQPAAKLQVLFLSGDAGMRRGMGPFMARAFAARGIEVTALSTSTLFRFGRTRAELDGIVAAAVAQAERRKGSARLIVVGQSYGADILQTALADLPPRLRAGIAGVVLIVPGTGTYFRADPTSLLYYLTPDSESVTTVPAVTWAPVTCIYGALETDSVCPLLKMANATVIRLPGNHYLAHDKPRVAATVLQAFRRSLERGAS